jgi:hypothetical protein
MELIGSLLERDLANSNLSADDRAFAAAQFILMVVALPQRRAMGFGTTMRQPELEAWAVKVVRLFLDGCRGLGR